MLNWLWSGLLLCGFLFGAINGQIDRVLQAAWQGAQQAVELALGLVGIMAFWLGILRIAEEAGLVNGLARLLRPLLIRLFPDVPVQHPAMGAMLMNIAANLLGLGNAATPLGLLAMQELQKLNGYRDEASNAMCTFLVLNTACFTLIPTTVIALRAKLGAQQPTDIIGPTMLATLFGLGAGLLLDRWWRRRRWW
ncbi:MULTISPECIES: nucleoside recognition domain-containing protein [Carboxydocella]|uniref:Spore maturation protein A n=2 Tax=Carboxydocella TaxID=178898 RepID=A0A1T4MQR2_9FIRM|nr:MULTISPECIES: nucleoside recognition domain-containing protein [Carboxydocella]AVX20375.1 spore maturation protein A [Carboxydocella thermautotrophica]AVX30799.1 spore maturation protein A [Carboxydocella thermautotrophica]SJZ69211.1 spore maturation protein A [Carboxydocella sporoproducens DSM 16521]GAW30056.1 nucleoside recognition protein [Carboxydocella sp. ULO1]GAW31204.1 nucleoside recognition protein [Carboxydocella sp. JDF658]